MSIDSIPQSIVTLMQASARGSLDQIDLITEIWGIPLVVDDSVPQQIHALLVIQALEHGCHVLVEKPMASTLEECRQIVTLVAKNGRRLMVGHCMRFYTAIEKMKEKQLAGHLGDLEVVTMEAVMNGPFSHGAVPKPVSEWWFDPKKAGGGVLLDLGYHLIDLFRFFEGDSRVIFSTLDHKFNLPIEDGAILILRSLNSSTKGLINVGWYQKLIFPHYNFRCILHGNAGYLSSDDLVPKNMYRHAVKEGTKNFLRRITGRKIRLLSYTYYYEAYYKELLHFLDCIRNDTEPSISASDGLKTMETVQEAYRFLDENYP